MLSQPMLAQQQAVDAVSPAANLAIGGATNVSHTIKWTAGTAGGAVTIETSDVATDPDTWGAVATVVSTATALKGKTDVVNGLGPYGKFVRHRISTMVPAGSVSSRIESTE